MHDIGVSVRQRVRTLWVRSLSFFFFLLFFFFNLTSRYSKLGSNGIHCVEKNKNCIVFYSHNAPSRNKHIWIELNRIELKFILGCHQSQPMTPSLHVIKCLRGIWFHVPFILEYSGFSQVELPDLEFRDLKIYQTPFIWELIEQNSRVSCLIKNF